ncbi:hypothetical protein [Herbidospora mongoliensis]|uniref:hypothetical protein n=1 Tax=Herbidospora mongoliensis TaxID=688067 RepID=UPI00083122C0|nr:hypothetical protein [Herbidospora mongoliensis]
MNSSDIVLVTAKESPTQLRMKLSADQVDQGEPLVVSGLARWRPRGGWQPLAEVPLTVKIEHDGSETFSQEITTGPDGRYSITVPTDRPGTVTVDYETDDPFKANTQESAAFTITQAE